MKNNAPNAKRSIYNFCSIHYLISNKTVKVKEAVEAFPEFNKNTVRRHVLSFNRTRKVEIDLEKQLQDVTSKFYDYFLEHDEHYAVTIARDIFAIIGFVSSAVYAYNFFF